MIWTEGERRSYDEGQRKGIADMEYEVEKVSSFYKDKIRDLQTGVRWFRDRMPVGGAYHTALTHLLETGRLPEDINL